MDTISRENNPSILPVVGAILGGLGLILAIVALVKLGQVKKLAATVDGLNNQVSSMAGDVSTAKDTANRANSSVSNLATQTQRGFDAVTAEIGNIRTDLNKLATAKTSAPKAKEGAAVLLPQHATDADKLAAQLTEVLMHPEKLKTMGRTARTLAKPDATRTVVDICLEVARG